MKNFIEHLKWTWRIAWATIRYPNSTTYFEVDDDGEVTMRHVKED